MILRQGVESAVKRVMAALEDLRRIGADAEGGTTRLAYTKADMEAREWLLRRLGEAGLRAEVDAVGNVFGWFPAKAEGEPVLVGSHIDTVAKGGYLDGTLGVIAAVEAFHLLREAGWEPATPLAVVSFACEEASRFGMSSVGSRALAGRLAPHDLDRLRDRHGITLREALSGAGLAPEQVASLRRPAGWFRAYVEAHIDQGPDLEEARIPLAVVTAIAGTVRYRVTFAGDQAHAGASRMGRRRDALAAAAEAILIVEREANARQEEVVATVGEIEAKPGMVNVVPGEVVIGLEIRASSVKAAEMVEGVLRDRMDELGATRGVAMLWEEVSRSWPAILDTRVGETLKALCREEGIPEAETVSWPGHDALYLADQGAVGMVLVRNRGKVSHHPDEAIRPSDLALLLLVLGAAIMYLAGPNARDA